MADYILIKPKEDSRVSLTEVKLSLKEQLYIEQIKEGHLRVNLVIDSILFSADIYQSSGELKYKLIEKIKDKLYNDYDVDVINKKLNISYTVNGDKFTLSVQLSTSYYYEQHKSKPDVISKIKYNYDWYREFIDIVVILKDREFHSKNDGTQRYLLDVALYGRISGSQSNVIKNLLDKIKNKTYHDYSIINTPDRYDARYLVINYYVLDILNEIKIHISKTPTFDTTVHANDCVIL